MGLLPKGYDHEQASSSNSAGLFIKLLPGENKFRILGLWLLFQTWGADGKPIRYRANVVNGQLQKPRHLPFNGRAESKFGEEKWKHVWYCLVWSYADNDLKILEVPQATVQKQLAALDADDDWGSLDNYDIKIIRSGEKMETEYSVIGVPPKPLPKRIKEAVDNASINLDAIVYGAYPDDPEWHDKALEKLINNIDLACKEAAKRELEFEPPTTTDLVELQGLYEKAMDLMPLHKTPLPTVSETVLDKPDPSKMTELEKEAELSAIPF